MEYHGQVHQDEFVVEMLNSKRDGFYLELGANDTSTHSNTFVIYNKLNWRGIMVEYDWRFLSHYQRDRPRSIPVIGDGTQMDYLQLLTEHQFPKNIDYFQLDLDVDNRSTLTTLEKIDKTVMDQYTFATMTIEHDIYTGDFFNTRARSREILANRGYVRVFSDVCVYYPKKNSTIPEWNAFEDWYAHPSLVDRDLIASIVLDEANIEGSPWPQSIELLKTHAYNIYHKSS